MKIIIDVGHPATVHFFKYFARKMIDDGNVVLFTCRNKDVAINLLKIYNFNYISFGKFNKGVFGKLLSIIKFDFYMLKVAINFKPDIFLSAGSLYSAHASFFLRKPNITIHNTDIDFQIKFNKPFTDVYLTPSSFTLDLGRKHIRFKGYNELAFLHPKYFKPNYNTLTKLGITKDEKYVLLRFVSWDAHDDFDKIGFSEKEIREIIFEFSKVAKVLISSEYTLPDDLSIMHLERNDLIQPGELQDVEYYASLLYGESGAVAAECAMLGTPAFYISHKKMGFLTELDTKYNLIFDRRVPKGTLEQALAILKNPDSKKIWQAKSKKMIEDNINVTDFLLWFTINYPLSKQIMINNPEYQFNFK